MERDTEEEIAREISKTKLKKEVVLKQSKPKKTYKPVNLFYSKDAIFLINKLSKYLKISKNQLSKNIINSSVIVSKVDTKDLKLKSLKDIQKTLTSNLKQLGILTKFVKEEFNTFSSFQKDNLSLNGTSYKIYEILELFLENSKKEFDKFQNIKLKLNDDTSEEIIEIMDKIKAIDYINRGRRNSKDNSNRLYFKLSTEEYYLLLNHSIHFNEHKTYLRNKDNVKNKPNLTAAFWKLLTEIEPKNQSILITEIELQDLKILTDKFNEKVHKANACKKAGIDFKTKDLYYAAVDLHKTVKELNNKYSGA